MQTPRERSWLQEALDRTCNRPVIPLLVALMAGIRLGTLRPGHLLWGWLAAGAGLLLCASPLLRARPARLAPMGLFLAVGYLLIQPWAAPRFPDHHVARHTGETRWEISGRVAGDPLLSQRRTRFVLAVDTLRSPQETVAATGKIRVTVADGAPGLAPGDRVRFSSRLRAPRNFNNPGGFDYRRHLAFEGVWVTAFCAAGSLRVLDQAPPAGGAAALRAFRSRVSGLIEGAAPGAGPRGLLKALVLGDRAAVPADLLEAFNRAGVSHLLAISGLHVGMVAAGAFWLFSGLLAFVRPLLWRGSTRKWAACLTFFPVAAYGLLAGMSPSTQRAVIMVTVFLAAVCLDRDQDPVNTLAVAALVILAVHPPALFSVSFQLSFSAVAAILLGVTGRQAGPAPALSPWERAGRRVLAFFLVSALAILGTLPLVMRTFNQASLAGLAANAVAVPIVGGAVVPLALFSAFLGLLWPDAAVWGFALGAWLLDLVLPVIRALAGLPLAAVKTVTPSTLEIAAYYLLFGAALHLLRRGRAPQGMPLPHRRAAWAATALALVVLAGDAAYWLHARFRHGDLRATVIDVGQGSATLLEFPRGPVMLVDGGGFPDHEAFDVGARVVAPFLWSRKIRTVDILVLSHPDSDHLNGLLYIAEHFHVRQLWSTGDPSALATHRRLRQIAAERAIDWIPCERLPRSHDFNGAMVEILHPPAGAAPDAQELAPETRNDRSLVLRASLGSRSILLPGDLMAKGEAQLAEAVGAALESTVLLAPHHGSRGSSTQDFLRRVLPRAVIVSADDRGRGTHPHPAVLARYAAGGADVFRTSADGAVSVRVDGESLRIRPFLSPSGAAVYR